MLSSLRNVVKLLYFVVTGCCTSLALADSEIDRSYSTALEMGLHQAPVWLTILGYEEQGISRSRRQSALRSSTAFLDPAGSTNPSAELAATLSAFFNPVSDTPDDHAQCRFRARYVWLDAELDLASLGMKAVPCGDFDNWKRHESVNSISVLMVGGFLENPASYYGHNMIKLNSDHQNSNNLQNESINFGADIPATDGIFRYIFNGITGNYTGVFSSSEFFHFANNYGEIEQRDIWEYPLNLTEYELSLMLALVWEFMQADFTYYFFNKNCAYQMARLFSVLRGIDLVGGHNLWYAPQTFIQRLANQEDDKRLFAGRAAYHPSRQSRFYERYYDLNDSERHTVRTLVSKPDRLADSEFQTLEIATKYRVLDVLMDYYQYTSGDGQGNVAFADSPYNSVLGERYRLPAGEAVFAPRNVAAPHESRNISYAAVAYAHNPALGSSWQLKLRPAYYDALDYNAGHVPNAALSMAEIELVGNGDHTGIRNISLIKIESVNMQATGLPEDSRRTWALEVGAQQDRYDDIKSTVARARAQIGRAYPLRSIGGVVGVRVGGAVQSSYRDSGYGYLSVGVFASGALAEKIRLHLGSEYRAGYTKTNQERRVDSVSIRYEVARNLDVRLLYEKNVVSEIGLSVGVYW